MEKETEAVKIKTVKMEGFCRVSSEGRRQYGFADIADTPETVEQALRDGLHIVSKEDKERYKELVSRYS